MSNGKCLLYLLFVGNYCLQNVSNYLQIDTMSSQGEGEPNQYCCNDLKSYALAMPAVSTYHAISPVLCHKGCYEEQGIYFTNECG